MISIDGNLISEQTSSSQVHIEDGASGLNIYVPKEEGSRDTCYLSALPRRLVEWVMTDAVTLIQDEIDSDMVVAMTAVINAKFLAVEQLLDEQGIVESDAISRDSEEEPKDSTRSVSSNPSRLTPREPTPLDRGRPSSASGTTGISRLIPLRCYNSHDDDTPQRSIPATDLTRSHSCSPRPITSSYSHYLHRDDGSPDPFWSPSKRRRSATNVYNELLSQIVAAARRSQVLSSAFDVAELSDALPGGSATSVGRVFDEFSLFGSQVERNGMVGAAGELFVSFPQ